MNKIMSKQNPSLSDSDAAGNNAKLVVTAKPEQAAVIRGLFISALVLAGIGFFSKFAAAMGLSVLDPVKLIQSQLVSRIGAVGREGLPGAVRLASALNFFLDSLVSVAVILIAVAIGLINGYFDPK